MKERASFTNAIVSTAPAPIRNPRRDCSIKKSSEMAHASGGLATYCCPCGPHRRATVAGLRLVGGTVRSSQDADRSISHWQPMSMVEMSHNLTFHAGFRDHKHPSLRQLVEQGLGLLQVQRVKALGEPAIDRRQQITGFVTSTLLLEQPGKAGRGTQFERFRLLAAGKLEAGPQARFGGVFVSCSEPLAFQVQDAGAPEQLIERDCV